MRCACAALLLCVACPGLPYFSTVSHKRYDFREKVTEYKACVLIFSINFVRNIFRSKKNSARHDQKCAVAFMQSIRHSCQILIKI